MIKYNLFGIVKEIIKSKNPYKYIDKNSKKHLNMVFI